MKLSIQAGATSQTINVFIRDSSSTTGAGLTGLVFNSASLVAYYALPKAAAVQITLATLAAITTAWSSGGFKEVDATNMPGWYRLDIPDAALASGRFVSIHLKGATNMAPLPIEIELTATNNQSATAFVTGINSLNPPTNWNLESIDANGRLDISKILGTAISTPATAGVLDVNVKNMNNVTAASITTIKAVQGLATDGVIPTATNLTNAPTAGDFTATMKTSLNAATPAVTVSDKTGFSLSTAGILAIWHQLTSAIVTVSTIGKLLVDDIDATISSRTKPADTQARVTLVDTLTTYTGNTPQTGDGYALANGVSGFVAIKAVVDAIKVKTDQLVFTIANKVDSAIVNAASFAQAAADLVWGTAARTLTAFGFTVTVATNNDKTGYTLSAAGIQAVWDALTVALTTLGSIGKLLVDNINATITSRASSVALATVQADTDDIQTRLPAVLVAGRIDASVGAMAASVITSTSLAANGLSAIASKVWDEPIAGHIVPGMVGEDLDTARINTDNIKTRLPAALVGAKMDSTLSSSERDAIATALLDLANAVETGETVRQALRLIAATTVGKLSGAGTGTETFRNSVADSKNRVVATVDASGNRTAITTDGT